MTQLGVLETPLMVDQHVAVFGRRHPASSKEVTICDVVAASQTKSLTTPLTVQYRSIEYLPGRNGAFGIRHTTLPDSGSD